MINYTQPFLPESEVTVSAPQRVYFNFNKDYTVVRDWLEANCQHGYYVSLPWFGDFIDFEDAEEAMIFSLQWS